MRKSIHELTMTYIEIMNEWVVPMILWLLLFWASYLDIPHIVLVMLIFLIGATMLSLVSVGKLLVGGFYMAMGISAQVARLETGIDVPVIFYLMFAVGFVANGLMLYINERLANRKVKPQ